MEKHPCISLRSRSTSKPEILSDLRERIRKTRWPDQAPSALLGSRGLTLSTLGSCLSIGPANSIGEHKSAKLPAARSVSALSWTACTSTSSTSGPDTGHGVPLILTHGWPSTFVELLPPVPYLTDPHAHGIDGPAFDVVIPSLPGYGFSERPRRTGVNYQDVAGLWHRLMRGMGYERYGAQGGDFGAGITTFMALNKSQANDWHPPE